VFIITFIRVIFHFKHDDVPPLLCFTVVICIEVSAVRSGCCTVIIQHADRFIFLCVANAGCFLSLAETTEPEKMDADTDSQQADKVRPPLEFSIFLKTWL